MNATALTPAVLKAKNSKATALKRKLDKLYSGSAGLFYVGTEYIESEDMIHVWVNATANDETVDSGAFRSETRAWELYRLAQSVVNGIIDGMVGEYLDQPAPATAVRHTDTDGLESILRAAETPSQRLPKPFRTITEDQQAVDQRAGYRQVPCPPCGGTGRREAAGFAGVTVVCGMCCSHGTLWTNNPN